MLGHPLVIAFDTLSMTPPRAPVLDPVTFEFENGITFINPQTKKHMAPVIVAVLLLTLASVHLGITSIDIGRVPLVGKGLSSWKKNRLRCGLRCVCQYDSLHISTDYFC
jgi:hypothetical protein